MRVGDFEVSIGIGTWRMGGGYWEADTSRDAQWIEVIRYALEKGLTLVDTAEMYGGGHAEELVGKAVSGIERDSFFVVTKLWSNHLRYDDVIKYGRLSLRRLGLKYVDLLLIHWPNSSVPIGETVRAMERLVEEGTTRFIGVSNFNEEELRNAMESTSKYEIVANEIEYNVFRKDPEEGLIPFCEKSGVTVIAYTPLARGRVSVDPKVRKVAERYGRTPVQVALKYVMRRSIPIPKASSREHVDDIVGALGWNLSEDDYLYLKSV
ncbi:aldo/keto reductase [Sulfodiicoccus acidiphilus]|uniref:Aldo/keto reductase n=1 Tax=Sulfodiicoccus acidiphilus TaxID=1670455 RepID=A0A348B0G9_9CREN|nr:aldo/keto reductase [Sulfodiicoccus acidiphilus]BBD71671.1 aldo/keto reductase [Sulfodiicoccus acidiphilus]GGT86712.1 aldo/keto reductase [Sulfodiicoccus acidiphilus]